VLYCLDSTDVRIFCEMAFRKNINETFTERRPSAADVGKKLGLDEKTVRQRVKQMEEAGFIKYYQATPNLALFGMKVVSLFRFESHNLSTKFAIVNGLKKVPRLVEAADYLGPFLTCSIAGATPEEAQRESSLLAARYELGTVPLGSSEVIEPAARLDGLDWKLIQKLRYDARSSDRDVARSLAVTQRMVGYRLSKLFGMRVIQVKAIIDPRKQAGLVFYELELTIDPEKQNSVSRWLRHKHGESLWNLSIPRQGVILASLFCFTLAQPEDSVMEALKLEGVKRCILFILKEVIEPQRSNWIDSLIELRISSQSGNVVPIESESRE